jgi:acetyl esterase
MKRFRTKILFIVLNRYQKRLSAMSINDARRYFEATSSTLYKVKIPSVHDQKINDDGQDITIRVYQARPSNQPTIVYFHGGGFVVGSIDSHDTVARHLCRITGCTVVSVGYRLAPEFPYPAARDDGLAAVKWLQTQSTLNHQFILAGDSAGGQIAVSVATGWRDKARDNLVGLVLMYPALDPSLRTQSMRDFAEGHFVTRQNMYDFWNAYAAPGVIVWPLQPDIARKLPPTFVLTAEYDVLRDEGHAFFEQLKKLGVQAKYHNYRSTAHGIMQLPNFVGSRSKALRDIAEFVREVSSF